MSLSEVTFFYLSVYSVIYSCVTIYLKVYYVPSTFVGSKDMAGNETDPNPCPPGADVLTGGDREQSECVLWGLEGVGSAWGVYKLGRR